MEIQSLENMKILLENNNNSISSNSFTKLMFESLTSKYTSAHAKYLRTMPNSMLKIQAHNSNLCDQILVHT